MEPIKLWEERDQKRRVTNQKRGQQATNKNIQRQDRFYVMRSRLWHRNKIQKRAGLWFTEGWSIVNVTARTGAEWSPSPARVRASTHPPSLSSPHIINTHTRAADCWGRGTEFISIPSSGLKCCGSCMGSEISRKSKVSLASSFYNLDFLFIYFFF